MSALTITNTVHLLIAQVAPIDGISLGSYTDKSTWRIDFQDTATAVQRQAAQDAIIAFDAAAELAKPPPKSKIELLEARITALEAKVK